MRVRKRVTLMVITVSVIFGVSWLADSIYYILVFHTPTPSFGDATFAVTRTLIMFNSAINPIVYALVNQRFREKMKLMMRGCRQPATDRIYLSRELHRMQMIR